MTAQPLKSQKRRCQECGKVQFTAPPPDRNENRYWAWAEIKCRHCKSPALDYGKTVDMPTGAA